MSTLAECGCTPPPLDLNTLTPGCLIDTGPSWYQVVEVYEATVKVAVSPGMNDVISKAEILTIRHVPNNSTGC